MLLDLHGTRTNAPSGMRRLMVYQLQEAFLNDLEAKKEPVPEAATPKLVTPPLAKKRPTQKQSVEEPVEALSFPFLRKEPKVQSPTAYDLLAGIQDYRASFTVLIDAVKRQVRDTVTELRRQRRRRAVAFLLVAT